MRRIASLRRRLQRLEAMAQKRRLAAGRFALIVMASNTSSTQKHLVVTAEDPGFCEFREEPGPGPTLADFGEFEPVVYLTASEAGL